MAINIICTECKNNLSLRSKICKNCGFDFSNGRKYRVVVVGNDGRRISKVFDSLSIAKKYEGKLKTQQLEKSLFGVRQRPVIDDVWQNYLDWAKENKKSWKDDDMRWQCHVKQDFNGKRMDSITAFDVQCVISKMMSKRDYAPATVKHVIVLIRRVYNWASEMDLYSGENPASKIKLPKVNNEITECLTKYEISRLLKTLDGWKNQRAGLLIKFALFTGLRRGELFGLKWEDVDIENGWIYLRYTKGGNDTKLPVSEEALIILVKAKELLPVPDCQYVFPNRRGAKRTTIGKTWTRIKKCAKFSIDSGFMGFGIPMQVIWPRLGRFLNTLCRNCLLTKHPR